MKYNKDNNYELLPEQSLLIWRTSFLSLGSCIYALYKGHYYIAVVPGGVFITSINYWRRPDYSWRRYLDMAYVKLSLLYQLYHSYRSENRMLYYGILALSISFYPLGLYYHKKKKYWYSNRRNISALAPALAAPSFS